MSVVDVQADSFDREVKGGDRPVVVEFWIKSCPNCQKFRPVYESLPEIFGDKVKFFKVDMFRSLENLRLAEGLGVEETPTVKIFHEGEEIGEVVGYRSLDDVVSEIREILQTKDC